MKLKIIDMGVNGEGVAKQGDAVYFVPNALVNEIVDCEVLKTKENLNFCKLSNIIESDESRIDASCQYYGVCGGCDLQHTSYENQLRIKTQSVKTTLQKALGKEFEVFNCKPSEKTFNYRNKIEMPIKNNKVGFYQKNSHNIINVENCLICDDFAPNLIKASNEYLELVKSNNFKHIVARKLNEEIVVIIVTKNIVLPKVDELANIFSKYFKKFSIFQNINNKNHAEVLGKKYVKIFGADTQKITENFLQCEISPQAFVQVNNNVKTKLYNDVLNYVEDNNVVINAYSGAGYLTAMLAQKCEKVYGVEIDKNATLNANKLMKNNNIINAENICGDCLFELPKLLNKLKEQENKKLVLVLDPARKGVDSKVLNSIKNFNLEKIIYISCYPATLGRDLKILQENFEVKTIQPYDMFPQTKHVETVVVLKKNN